MLITLQPQSRRPRFKWAQKPRVQKFRRFLGHTEQVLSPLMYTSFLVEFHLQILLLFLKVPPYQLALAFPRLLLHTRLEYWWHPWDMPILQYLFCIAYFLGSLYYLTFREVKAVEEFALWISSLWYRLPASPSPMQVNVYQFSLQVLSRTREAPGMDVLLIPHTSRASDVQTAMRIQEEQPRQLAAPVVVESLPPTVEAAPVLEDIQETEEALPAEPPREYGVHMHTLKSFEMEVVGPKGTRIVSLPGSIHIQLNTYMAVKTYERGKVRVDDLLRDVYGCDDEEPGSEQRKAALDAFHHHCKEIREAVTEAAIQVGLPGKIDPFQWKRPYWCLSSQCWVDDLLLLKRCRQLLDAEGKAEAVDPGEVKATCEQVRAVYKGDLLAFNREEGQINEWVQEALLDVVHTYLDALGYLASDARGFWETATQDDLKRRSQKREANLWAECAICCARVRFTIPARAQQMLDRQREQALRRSLELYQNLNDSFAAIKMYRDYETQMREEDEEWEPDPQTARFIEQATRGYKE